MSSEEQNSIRNVRSRVAMFEQLKPKEIKIESSFVEPTSNSNTTPEECATNETTQQVESHHQVDNLMTKEELYVKVVEELMDKFSETNHKGEKVLNEQLLQLVEEFYNTEFEFLSDIAEFIDIYIPFIKYNLTSHHLARMPHFFDCILNLYLNCITFLARLQKCTGNMTKIAQTFIDNRKIFENYQAFAACRGEINILKELDKKKFEGIKSKKVKNIEYYMQRPLGRLGKYILFLEKLQEIRKGTDNVLAQAIKLVRFEVSKVNDLAAVTSITRAPFDLLIFGPYVKKDKFFCVKPKNCEMMVYFFEKILVFTTYVNDRGNVIDLFKYESSILVEELSLITTENDHHIIELRNPSDKYTIVLTAESLELKQRWVDMLEKRLFEQLLNCKEALLRKTSRTQ